MVKGVSWGAGNPSARRQELKVSKLLLAMLTLVLPIVVGCTPRVEVAPPSEPLTINLNVKIDHEVRVRVEKDLEEEVFDEDAGLF